MYWYMNKMEFADWLRSEIEKQGLTIADVAARGGSNPPTIWRIIRGERAAGVDSVIAIAKGLGVSPLEVFGRLIGQPLSERTAKEEKLIYLFDRLDGDKRQELLNFADFLLNR